MAIGALYRVPRRQVIGVGGRDKVSIVTVDTRVAYAVKFKAGFRDMASNAVSGRMRSQQREAIVEVEFHDVVYQPAFRSVAAAAVIAGRHSVHIGMAADTVRAGFRKNEGVMARTTVYLPVLPIQHKARSFMAKSALFVSQFIILPKGGGNVPAFCLVAGNAVLLELVAMWVLRRNQYSCQQDEQHKYPGAIHGISFGVVGTQHCDTDTSIRGSLCIQNAQFCK